MGDTAMVRVADLFLSTPSARRATTVDTFFVLRVEISIHALREEGDTPALGFAT